MENIVFNVCATFNDDRLWNEEALVLWKYEDNSFKNKHKNNNNNVDSAWGPVSGSKNRTIVFSARHTTASAVHMLERGASWAFSYRTFTSSQLTSAYTLLILLRCCCCYWGCTDIGRQGDRCGWRCNTWAVKGCNFHRVIGRCVGWLCTYYRSRWWGVGGWVTLGDQRGQCTVTRPRTTSTRM